MSVTVQPPRPRHSRRGVVTAALLVLLMSLLGSACSGADDATSSASSSTDDASSSDRAALVIESEAGATFDQASDSAGAKAEATEAPQASTTGSAAGQPASQLPDLGRDIIYTARLELATTDVSGATREAIRAVEARGGFLFSQETQGGAGGSSVLVFKVQPEHFQRALSDLGSVGTVRSQSISADDVTAVVVDLESRINTAQASVIRLRNLLEGATELETIATLENQLLQRETTLEQLRGQLRTVENQVDLATVTVYVTELLSHPSMTLAVTTFSGHDGGFSCLDTQDRYAGESGDAITLCYRLTNTGDAQLVDLTIDERGLGDHSVTVAEMIDVDGTSGEVAPGETAIWAHEITLTDTFRLTATASATALDDDANPFPTAVRSTASTTRFDVVDTGFPSFGDVAGKSLSALGTLFVLIALVAVGAAPFLAAAFVLGYPALRLVRRYRTPSKAKPPSAAPRAPEPPSPAAAPDASAASQESTVDQ